MFPPALAPDYVRPPLSEREVLLDSLEKRFISTTCLSPGDYIIERGKCTNVALPSDNIIFSLREVMFVVPLNGYIETRGTFQNSSPSIKSQFVNRLRSKPWSANPDFDRGFASNKIIRSNVSLLELSETEKLALASAIRELAVQMTNSDKHFNLSSKNVYVLLKLSGIKTPVEIEIRYEIAPDVLDLCMTISSLVPARG